MNDDINETQALELRHPGAPLTLDLVSTLKGEALEIIEARIQVIETLRVASIRTTSPADWLLFKAPDEQGGQVVGYLQDCGADRVRDFWGIEIFDVDKKPEKVLSSDPGVFHYIIRGSGRCKLTKQILESVEGGRSSTDDFCKDKKGAELELAVRKAARANLDGNITRELAGMKSVPTEELIKAWEGTNKSIDQCRHGRGFGSRDERLGATSEKEPDIDPPTCPHCGTKGKYRAGKPGGKGPFYGCPKYQTHEDKKWIVNAAEWIAKTKAAAKPAAPERPPADTDPAQPAQAPLLASDVGFSSGKKPGAR